MMIQNESNRIQNATEMYFDKICCRPPYTTQWSIIWLYQFFIFCFFERLKIMKKRWLNENKPNFVLFAWDIISTEQLSQN